MDTATHAHRGQDAAPGQPGYPGPLVQPGPELTADQRARAQRQISLPGFDELAQRRLAAARVLVIGAGGLGSASIPYLVGAGVGRIGVVDDDTVELSNLHRQIAHGSADVGRSKAASMADRAHELDPSVVIDQHRFRLTSENAREVFSQYDLVIDGSDNFPTRYLANDAAELVGIPLVWGAILQYHGQVGVAWHAHGPGYRDLFPAPPAPENVMSCEAGGVLPGLCGTVGSLLATEAMKLIVGIGDPLIGRVLLYDSLTARTCELPYRRDPEGEPVTELIDYELFCQGPDPAPPATEAGELVALLREAAAPRLLDVRSAAERERMHISGSDHMPVDELEQTGSEATLGAFGSPITVYCERDPRSIRAAKILIERGFTDVRYLVGGVRGFAEAAPQLLVGDELENHRV
ncbi:MAG: ThiF family adenylyltransferase [Leucobacter sp.]